MSAWTTEPPTEPDWWYFRESPNAPEGIFAVNAKGEVVLWSIPDPFTSNANTAGIASRMFRGEWQAVKPWEE